MPSFRSKLLLLTAVAVLVTPVVFANATRLPSQDAWVVARGHIATASVDSSAAVWYNPAGLSRIPRLDIRVEPSALSVDESFRSSATGRTVDERSSTFFTPSAYAAFRLNDSVVVGAGILSPYGLSSDWPADSGFAGLATFNEIKYQTGVASVAYKVWEGLSLGASLEYSSVEADLNRLTPIAPGIARTFTFTGRDHAMSGNFGVQWDIDAKSSVGLLYQLPTTVHFNGTATLDGVLSAPGKASGWRFADNLAISYRYKFAPDWEVEVGVDWTFWGRTRDVRLDAGPLSSTLPLSWKTSAYYGIGLEHRISEHWRVAGGYQYSENSVPDASFSPSLPDSTRQLVDAGVEYAIGPWQLQMFAELSFKSSRTIRPGIPDGLGGTDAGTFDNRIRMVGISVGYRL